MHVSSLPTAADADAAGPTALLLLLPPPLLLLLLLMPSSPARALLVCGCGASGSSRLLELLPIAAPPGPTSDCCPPALGAAAAYVKWLKTGPTGDTTFPTWQASRAAKKWRSREGRGALEEMEALGALPQHTAL